MVKQDEEMKRRENVTLKFQGAEEALDNSLKKNKGALSPLSSTSPTS